MSLFNSFGTDHDKEVMGVEVPYPEATNSDGSIPTFVVASMSPANKRFASEFEKETRPYRTAIDNNRLDAKTSQSIVLKVFVASILRGWKNVFGSDGKELEFTKENAIKLLEALPRLYADLQVKANDINLYKPEDKEKDLKN